MVVKCFHSIESYILKETFSSALTSGPEQSAIVSCTPTLSFASCTLRSGFYCIDAWLVCIALRLKKIKLADENSQIYRSNKGNLQECEQKCNAASKQWNFGNTRVWMTCIYATVPEPWVVGKTCGSQSFWPKIYIWKHIMLRIEPLVTPKASWSSYIRNSQISKILSGS